MMRSKTTVVGCILACLAVAGIASSANAAVFAGVVGGPGGIHMQYGPGPETPGGDYLGIASESYEGLWDWGSGFWPLAGPNTSAAGDSPGFVVFAFDPYTGEVWTELEPQHQGLTPSWGGHTPLTTALTDGAFSSDVAVADFSHDYTEDTIFVTSLWRDYRPYFLTGMVIGTSPDGGILSAPTADILSNQTPWQPEDPSLPIASPSERALMSFGDEVRPYGAGEALPITLTAGGMGPDATDYNGVAQDFATEVYGKHVWWRDYPAGQGDDDGGGTVQGLIGEGGLFGFEMDGIRGWFQLDYSIGTDYWNGVGGVRLTEYYFDVPEPATMSLLAIGGIAALIRRRK